MIYDTGRGASRELVRASRAMYAACKHSTPIIHTQIYVSICTQYLSRCANTIIQPTKQFSTYPTYTYVFSYSTAIIEFDRMPKMQITAHYIIFYCMRLRTSAEVVSQAPE